MAIIRFFHRCRHAIKRHEYAGNLFIIVHCQNMKSAKRTVYNSLWLKSSNAKSRENQKSKVIIVEKVKSRESLRRESSKLKKRSVSRPPAHSVTHSLNTSTPRAPHRS